MPLSAVPSPTLRLLRPSPRPAVASACCPVCSPQPVAETAVGQAFATFLRLEVARGAASPDTQRGYWSQAQTCCVVTASAPAVKAYRQALVEAGYQAASIAHKLAVQHMLGHADPRTTARYAHLVERLQQNPALAVPVGV